MNIHLRDKVRSYFKPRNNTSPLIIFAPGRINLIGEHTDYNYGYAIPAAINLGVYLVIQSSPNNYSTVYALDKEDSVRFTFNNLNFTHKASWKNYVLGVVQEVLDSGYQIENFEAAFTSDLPIGAGLSSSAALENSMVFGLNELFNLELSKLQMALISQKAEQNYAGVNCGLMDQYASIFGKENMAIFLDCKSNTHVYVPIDFPEHEIILINSNIKHNLMDSEYNKRRETCKNITELLKVESLREVNIQDLHSIKDVVHDETLKKARYVIHENDRVLESVKALYKGDINKIGQLLYESHKDISKNYEVSCAELDYIVALTRPYPAILGSRMMGGGFGGCTIQIARKGSYKCFEMISEEYYRKFNIRASIHKVSISQGVSRL